MRWRRWPQAGSRRGARSDRSALRRVAVPRPLYSAMSRTRSAFDRHAGEYAAWEFDASAAAQRARVHAVLARVVPPGSAVLDLGCGTGIDAAHLARQGHPVVGLDVSPDMLALARSRCSGLPAEFFPMDLSDPSLPPGPFGAALSNFGALNCAPLAPVARAVADRLSPGAPFVVVLIARTSPAEALALLARGRFHEVARRRRDTAVVAGVRFPFHAPSTAAVVAAFQPFFRLTHRESLGVVLPVPGALGWPLGSLATLLAPLDRRLGVLPGFRRIGDHVIFVFRRLAATRAPD